MLLAARSLAKAHALRTLFEGVSISVDSSDRVGLIGPNGAGKSTLLRILAGLEQPDEGDVVRTKGLRAVYVPQQDAFPPGATARAAATAAGEAAGFDHHEADILAGMILERIGFDDAHAAAPADALSGGWRKRLSIACALVAAGGEPDLLLLDEPTNHLDLRGIRWLDRFVKGQTGLTFASVFVSHDRAFLESAATRVVELSAAYPQGTLAVDGDYSEFLRRKKEFLDGQAQAERAMANQVRSDLAWLSRRAKARRTKAKSRIESSHERIDELAELKSRNAAAVNTAARVDFDSTGRRTRKLIEARAVSKSYGPRTLFRDLDIELGVGDCLGLLGPNGSGKTTLIRVLTGEVAPDDGAVLRAEPAPKIAVFSQHRRDFAPETLLRDALSPGGDVVRFRGQPMHITAWSRRFLFRDEQLQQPVKTLSGGELARIHIARLMLEPADVLVLDEPTNDLDIPTLETLEESLEDFPGAIVLVTHDRAMLDRLAGEILALDGRGGAGFYATIDQALAAEERAEAAAEPRAAAPKPQPAKAPPPPARKKLSYNEQREYDSIEQRIQQAEAKAAAAEALMNDPAVLGDRARMARACDELSAAQAEVARLYARWEELEAKRG